MKPNISTSAALATLILGMSHAHAWKPDNGDGTFTNPPMYADYPDPDITRVGDYFYMISSSFVNTPGLTVMRSQDMVNWSIIGHVIKDLDGGDPYNLNGGEAYRGGVWASAIRFYKGTYYILAYLRYGGSRMYYSTKPEGPWQFHQLQKGLHDPGFFIDTDGTGYVMSGGGNKSLTKLNKDFSSIESNKENVLTSPGEGSHIIKRGEYYYVFNADPGHQPFRLMVSRSKNIYGPYETKESLTEPNGGHQGAIVDLPDGKNWFGFVMKDCGAIGRMTNVSPIFWENDWPIWGTPEAPNKVPDKARKPIQGKPAQQPGTSDDFKVSTLALQWQWNHNPDNSRWSLTERPGFLRLKPTKSAEFWLARNTLTQKGQGPWSRGEVKLDVSKLKPGDVCGFGTLGKFNGHIAVNCGTDGKLFLSMSVVQDQGKQGRKTDLRVESKPITAKAISLRTDLDFKTNKAVCSYSDDGRTWTPLGGPFTLAFDWQAGTFQGQQFAIFCYNPQPGDGFVDVDSFIFSDKNN